MWERERVCVFWILKCAAVKAIKVTGALVAKSLVFERMFTYVRTYTLTHTKDVFLTRHTRHKLLMLSSLKILQSTNTLCCIDLTF